MLRALARPQISSTIFALAMSVIVIGCTSTADPPGEAFPPATGKPGTTRGPVSYQGLCATAVGLADDGQAEGAITALVEALKADPAAPCTSDVIQRLAPAETTCSKPEALLAAGFPDKASDAYVELLKKPDLSFCAAVGLPFARRAQIRALCTQANAAMKAGQIDAARTAYGDANKLRSQLVAGGSPPGSAVTTEAPSTCGADGLERLDAEQATQPPAIATAARQATRFAWWALLAVVAFLILMNVYAKWKHLQYRFFNGKKVLVPRVRVAEYSDGADGQPGGTTVTPIIRRLMRESVADDDALSVDNVLDDLRFDDLMAAVKDIDAKLAAYAQLVRLVGRWVWPWSAYVLTGQLHEAPVRGQGVSTWFAEGKAGTGDGEFWTYPLGDALDAPEQEGVVAEPAGQSPSHAPVPRDSAYDLLPAAAAWATFEVNRVTFYRDPALNRPGAAIGHAYVVAGNARLKEGDRKEAIRFYKGAEQADGRNKSAKTARLLAEAGMWDYLESPGEFNLEDWIADLATILELYVTSSTLPVDDVFGIEV